MRTAMPPHFQFTVVTTLAVLALISSARAQNAAPGIDDVPELAGFRERWTAALKTLDVPGFSVAVVKDGKVLAVDGFGVRNVAGDPVTPDTFYYIASATKPYTAMAVCLLAGEPGGGKVDLDAPVKKYLPQLQLPDEDLTNKITVRDLLCHRHGIACGPIVHRDAYTGQITDEIYFRLLRDHAEIAHQVRYENVHFTLAGRVIEAVSGQKWQDYLNDHLFEPAGMTRTTAYASEMYGDNNHADPMLLIDGKWEASPLVKTDRTMHAAGGMGTTARDAARWLMLNLNGGEIDGNKILPKALAREYYTRQSAHPEPRGRIRIEQGFALGWNIGKYREQSRPYYFHGGGYVGTGTYFCFVPNERIGVAVMANSDGGGGIATIVSIDILDRLLGMTGQSDLLPAYEAGAKERREDPQNRRPTGVNPASARNGLTQPIEKYVGMFTHARDGELEVFVNERAELAARSGDLNFTLFTRGADKILAYAVPGMTLEGSFELGADGTVAAVILNFDDGPTRYERVKGN